MHAIRLILPLFIVILIGYALRRTQFVGPDFGDELNKVVYFFGLPALLFSSLTETDPALFRAGLTAAAFPAIVLAMAVIAFATTMWIPYDKRGSAIQAVFRGDVGYLGLAMVGTIIGAEALGTSAIIIAVGALIYAALSIFVLSIMKPGRHRYDLSPGSSVS